MAYKSRHELERVNMNLPKDLVDSVKAYADKIGVNVTTAYIFLLQQALQQNNTMENLPPLLNLLGQLKSLDDLKNEDLCNDINDLFNDIESKKKGGEQ